MIKLKCWTLVKSFSLVLKYIQEKQAFYKRPVLISVQMLTAEVKLLSIIQNKIEIERDHVHRFSMLVAI